MTFFRFLYFKSGELLTLCAAAAFVLYLLNSFSGATTILDNEKTAKETLDDILLAEKNLTNKKHDPAAFDGLTDSSRRLSALKIIPLKGYPDLGLATDGAYYYLLKASPPPKTEPLYLPEKKTVPGGFQILCWPARFAVTGEKSLYADGTGAMAESPNVHGALNGLNDFPPDFSPAFHAAPKGKPRKGNEWIRTDGPGDGG